MQIIQNILHLQKKSKIKFFLIFPLFILICNCQKPMGYIDIDAGCYEGLEISYGMPMKITSYQKINRENIPSITIKLGCFIVDTHKRLFRVEYFKDGLLSEVHQIFYNRCGYNLIALGFRSNYIYRILLLEDYGAGKDSEPPKKIKNIRYPGNKISNFYSHTCKQLGL